MSIRDRADLYFSVAKSFEHSGENVREFENLSSAVALYIQAMREDLTIPISENLSNRIEGIIQRKNKLAKKFCDGLENKVQNKEPHRERSNTLPNFPSLSLQQSGAKRASTNSHNQDYRVCHF